jgi:site-specific DNA recombinase
VIVHGKHWGCGGAKVGTGCTNTRQIKGTELDDRVLQGATTQMLHPDVVGAYVIEYHRDFAREAAEIRKARSRIERQLAAANAKVDRLVMALTDDRLKEIAEIAEALSSAKAERDALATELENIEAIPVLALHPHIATVYRQQVEHLAAALADPEARPEAMPIARALIDRVVMTPRAEGKGVELDMTGRLQAIIAIATGAPVTDLRVSGGAGSGNRTRAFSLGS